MNESLAISVQALVNHGNPQAPDWLKDRRELARSTWLQQKIPTRKTEDWKYTSLFPLQQQFQTAEQVTAANDALNLNFPQLGGPLMVFVDGHFDASLSRVESQPGLTLCHFSEADQEQAAQIVSLLGSAIVGSKHLFSDLNDATLSDGLFIHIEKDRELTAPIQLVWVSTEREQPASINQRLLLLAESNSKATVVEHFTGNSTSFTNGISELILRPGAKLQHSRLHLEGPEALHIGGVHTRLEKDSLLESFHLATGSKLKRIDLVVDHQGEGAHSKLDGIYLLRGEEHVDYHSCIEHAVPHCTSEEVFRGIIGDKARAVFNGRIHIHPDAQKTRAELSNKNLLTSRTAEINTKPELEIYADDVQCAHGATVAQLDDAMLHYLRTRGIPAAEAQVMLSYGFINELVESHPLPAMNDFLKPLLADYFGGDTELTRHIG